MSRPENPERFAANRTRIARDIRAALRDGGLHIVPQRVVDGLVDLTVEELVALRERISGEILKVVGRYDGGGINDRGLEMLALMTEYHYVDEDGCFQVACDLVPAPQTRE